VTVNLAPADMRKDGSGLDLPIALGILAQAGRWSRRFAGGRVYRRVSLEGRLRV
jgi:magnesium chelatase family protein